MNNRLHYHPLIIILYVSNMLSPDKLAIIPSSTRYRWNKFNHDNYDLEDWCLEYIKQFDDIKEVYNKKSLHRAVKVLTKVSRAYCGIMANLEDGKKLMREHALSLTQNIKELSTYTKLPIKKLVPLYGVTTDWYYRHREQKGCKVSLLKKCYQQHPNQLTVDEMNKIQNKLYAPENSIKTKTTLFYELANEAKLFCSKSTFFKYAKLLGFTKKKKGKKPRTKGFRASSCFEWLHIDIMQVQTLDDGVQKVAFVKDNYSKAILNYSTTNGKAGSEFIRDLMKETYEKHNMSNLIDDIYILTDGGTENKGLFLDWIENLPMPPVVRKITAKTDEFSFPNNMSESTHRIYKSEFKQSQVTQNIKTHLEDLEQFIEYYNYQRYPTELYGYHPMQIIEGYKPDKHRFKDQIIEARLQRIKTNQQFDDCPIYI